MIQAHHPDGLYHSNSLLFVGSSLCAGIGAFRRNIAGKRAQPAACRCASAFKQMLLES
jgi:hypothetical protein